MIELKDIVAIGGMPGIYHVIGQRKNGLIVEALDGSGKKFPTAANTKVSILNDIAMFTMEGEEKLSKILVSIQEKEMAGLVIPDRKAEESAFVNFLGEVLPNFDKEKIYLSDMKKLATWYVLLKDKIDFEVLKKEGLEDDKSESKADTKVKKVEKTVKNTGVKGDSKSKGKAVGTIRKMA